MEAPFVAIELVAVGEPETGVFSPLERPVFEVPFALAELLELDEAPEPAFCPPVVFCVVFCAERCRLAIPATTHTIPIAMRRLTRAGTPKVVSTCLDHGRC